MIKIMKCPVEKRDTLPEIPAYVREHTDKYRSIQEHMRSETAYRLLQSLIDLERSELVFTPEGKPYIKGNPLFFSIAHSGEMAVVAVSETGPVGTDIEIISGLTDLKLSNKCLDGSEFRNYQSSDNREKAFLSYWTAKEAYLKLTGKGLHGYPSDIHVGDGFVGSPEAVLIRSSFVYNNSEYLTACCSFTEKN